MVSFLGHGWNHFEKLLKLLPPPLLFVVFDHFHQELDLIVVEELIFVPFDAIFNMPHDHLLVEVRLLPVDVLEYHSICFLILRCTPIETLI